MSVIHNDLLLSGDDGYNLTKSLRFRSSASAYLNRTPASNGNGQTWTLSMWVKRGALSSAVYQLFGARNLGVSSPYTMIDFETSNKLIFYTQGSTLLTTQVFRDTSAWYHFVFVMDTTQATAANRCKIYVNGSQITAFDTATYPSQNFVSSANQNILHLISAGTTGAGSYTQWFDGYLAETTMVDGQALTPSSFGENNAQTGVWQPKRYSGTYGTNGFYLPFTDNSALTSGSNAGLGKDFSGNGNYWNTNNISITSGSTYDSMTDVPTLTSATAANFAVMNPLIKSYASQSYTLTNGNLQATDTGSGGGWCLSTISATSGKWYWEGTVTALGKALGIGWTTLSNISFGYNGCYQSGGNVNNTSGSLATTFASFTTNDVIGVAVDVAAGKVWFSKNGTFLGSGDPVAGTNTAFTFTGGSESAPTFCIDNIAGTSGVACNFGQRPFAYTPPTGYVALNTYNLPTPTIGATASSQANKYFDATLYSGNSSTQNIVNAGGFQPDLVWLKARSDANWHNLEDAVRGANKQLYSNSTNQETTNTDRVTAFNSNGFALGNSSAVNITGGSYVAWQWKANGSGSTNTAGSITSTVSANTTSGFSVVTWTGNGSSSATIGHGLGAAPKMIIIKDRASGAQNWQVYHSALGINYSGQLNTTNTFGNYANIYGTSNPTSSVFGANGSYASVNGNGGSFVAYCFAEIAGFSKFGSFVGNNSMDGPFVYLGFKPAFVMVKRTDVASDWFMLDNDRPTFNVIGAGNGGQLAANQSYAESTLSTYAIADFLSNGFKVRADMNYGYWNASGGTYIYMAFAESPFKYSTAR